MSKLSFVRSGCTFSHDLLFVGLLAGAFLFSATATQAMTFTVNSPSDVPDVNPGNGVCETAPGNGICTLRGAIQEANALAGADTIVLQPNITYMLTRTGADDTALNGDLDILDSVTIIGAGPGSTIIDGNGGLIAERVFQIFPCVGGVSPCNGAHPPIVVSMSGVTIEHGNSQNIGGGLINYATLTLTNCAISNNTATGINQWGGGIYNSGTLTLMKSTVSNNTGGGPTANNAYGGGIYNQGPMIITDSTISGNTTAGTPGGGGGIFNVGGGATVRNSTISGNTAVSGGGIYKAGGTLVVINSTISGNNSLGNGGGVFANSGTASLFNATVTQNRANSDASGGGQGGGLAAASGATLTFQNSIIAYNHVLIPSGGPLPILANDDCTGTITSQGNNIMHDVEASYCTVSGAVTIADPSLGSLASNGGATQTHALLTGSPAINAGNAGGCTDNLGAPLSSDQREYHRPDGTPCDIGAFEFNATIPVTLANISTRLRVESGDNALIGGFIIAGTQQKKVVVRAIGPSLSSFFPGVLADPILELRDSSGPVASNDNWRSDHQAEIISTGVQPSNDLESAIVATLPANNSNYTAIVRGVNNGTGIGVVEAYDLDRTIDSRLANISTRGPVSTGDNVMIGGTIILGNTSANVLFRAIGPSLTGFGVPNALPDPALELHDGNGALLASNDNWRSDQEAEIIATTIPPTNDLESAILRTLAPGSYTAIVRGNNNSTGVAVVEAYQLQ